MESSLIESPTSTLPPSSSAHPPSVSVPVPPSSPPNSPSVANRPCWREELAIFTSTFLTILLAELGDKTQVTTLLLSAQSQAPWLVFAGAGAALVATSLLGVLVGRWLASRIAPRTLEVSAGVLLAVLAALLVVDVIKG